LRRCVVARELEGVKFMMGSTMATTKRYLAEIGGFEEMVDLHSDDYELGRRIAARGYHIELLPEPVWMAFPSQTLGAYSAARVALGNRNPQHPPGRPLWHAIHNTACRGRSRRPALALPWVSQRCTWAHISFSRFAMPGRWGMGSTRSDLRPSLPGCLRLRDLASFFVWLASFGINQIQWRGAAFTLEKAAWFR